MDGALDRSLEGCHRLALAGICIAQATFITASATAAQNEPQEVPSTFFHARAALEF
jgi:hypothetical protein